MPKNRLPSPITDFVDISQDVEIFGEFKWPLQALPPSFVLPETETQHTGTVGSLFQAQEVKITLWENLGLVRGSQIQKDYQEHDWNLMDNHSIWVQSPHHFCVRSGGRVCDYKSSLRKIGGVVMELF